MSTGDVLQNSLPLQTYIKAVWIGAGLLPRQPGRKYTRLIGAQSLADNNLTAKTCEHTRSVSLTHTHTKVFEELYFQPALNINTV